MKPAVVFRLVQISLFFCFLFAFTQTFSRQQPFSESPADPTGSSDYNNQVIPPSPDASALAKYGDIPVSYYTGVPDISIPLYTVSGRKLTLPISLNYHASGFKVEEQASWVGLGWTLNAGGVITRTVRGKKDEHERGYLSLTDLQYAELQEQEKSQLISDISQGYADGEPDLFFFNVGGVSGKFFFDHNGNIILENPQHYILNYSAASGEIESWTLTIDDGTKYEFGGTTATEITNHSRESGGTPGEAQFSNTAWYLTKIISPDGLDEISFEYIPYTQNVDFNFSEVAYTSYSPYTTYDITQTACTREDMPCINKPLIKSKTVTIVHGKRLQRIVSTNQVITFAATFNRLDDNLGLALSEILIKDPHGNSIKKFSFSYSHFLNGGRLKLNSVTEIGLLRQTPIANPPFSFIYNEEDNLPKRDSMAIDFWGFYNGAQNSTLIPETEFHNTYLFNITKLPGADREPNEQKSKANLLTQVVYPTGGKTFYEYEGHNYSWEGGELIEDLIKIDDSVKVKAYQAGEVGEDIGHFVVDRDTFEIEFTQTVVLKASIKKYQHGPNPPIIFLTGPGIDAAWVITGTSLSRTIEEVHELVPGTYYLTAKTRWFTDSASATVQFKYSNGTTHLRKAGGVRIKKITSVSNSSPDLVKEFFYDDGTGVSSGILVSNPKFEHDQVLDNQISCYIGSSGPYPTIYACDYFVRNGDTQIPLSTTSGSHIGYYRVVVKSPGNGKEVFTFTSPNQFPDEGAETFPFFSKTSYDWARGKLLTHEVYDENQSQTWMLKNTNTYNLQNIGNVRGFLFRREQSLGLAAYYSYDKKHYDQITALAQLTSTVTEKVEQNGTLVETTSYTYDPIKGSLLKSSITVNSRGNASVNTIKYPMDAASISGLSTEEATALGEMVSKNMVAIPIEQTQDVGGVTTSKTRSNFKVSSISNSEFPSVSNAVAKESTELAFDGVNYITTETFNKIDNYGRPQEYKTSDQITNSFLWQSNGKLAAAVKNAVLEDVAYTGFEQDEGTGRWTYTENSNASSKTGLTSHQLTSTISKTGLNSSQQYIVSFWAKGGVPVVSNVLNSNDGPVAADGWQYFEKTVSGTSISIGGNNILIDELRMFPVGAIMTSYTYETGLGLVSTNDQNNQFTYYEYDSQGRLIIIRDHKRNIVKSFSYHYKNQN